MTSDPPPDSPTYREILGRAWPVVLASVSTPLLGLVDTAVIGQTQSAAALGAIAVGSLALSFIYWAFGFLRMSTTGFVAQAEGAGDSLAVRVAGFRALALGGALGGALCLLQWPLVAFGLPLLGAEGEVQELSRAYFGVRIWAAPATLMTYALTGIFIGLGETRALLALQLLLNGLNIGLDVWLAGGLGLGVRGIAIGTLIAEWTAAGWGCWLLLRMLRTRHADAEPFFPWARIRQADALCANMVANGNIMIRTLALLTGLAWVTRQGALLGETTLAANHVLLGIISFCAFFLDGIAFSTEALTGAAKGRRDLVRFDRAVWRSSVIATGVALTLGAVLVLGGSSFIRLLTTITPVVSAAEAMLPLVAGYVVLSVGAFQLDGIFIGTTSTREMRNAAVVSAACFVLVSSGLTPHWGQTGLWVAMLIWILLRALTLAFYFPAIRRDLRGNSA